MAEGVSTGGMVVSVAWSPRVREVREVTLQLPVGATLRDALRAGGLAEASTLYGIWGRPAALGQVLKDGDRVECYRPLLVDPKKARRERFARQGVRAAGLFAARRS